MQACPRRRRGRRVARRAPSAYAAERQSQRRRIAGPLKLYRPTSIRADMKPDSKSSPPDAKGGRVAAGGHSIRLAGALLHRRAPCACRRVRRGRGDPHPSPRAAGAQRRFQPNRLLEVTPEFLEDVLVALRDGGASIVSLDEMHRRLAAHDFSRRFVCLTFDDGYRDNLEWAYPVLSAIPRRSRSMWRRVFLKRAASCGGSSSRR